MNSRWTWLVVGLLWASSARAVVADPISLLELPGRVPGGGVWPVYGPCDDLPACSNLRNLTVLDFATETLVPGHVEIVHPDLQDAWGYFVPDLPFVVGSMLGATNQGDPRELGALYWVEVVEPTALSAASLVIDAQLSKQRQVARSECCPLLSNTVRARCLDTEVDTKASLFVGLNQVEAVTTQYLFELTLRDVRSTKPVSQLDFRPLTSSGLRSVAITFDGMASSYCYTVRALPLAGGTAIDLDERCIDNDLTGLGAIVRTPREIEQWLATCEAPPPDEGDEDADDDEPSSARDAGVAATQTDASQVAGVRASDGCQLAAPQTVGGAALWAALIALGATRRRRATRLRAAKASDKSSS